MSKIIKTKGEITVQLGHLWEQNTGWCTGWSGWDGTFTCKRCLSVLKSSRPNRTSTYKHEWMKDMNGNIVPRKDWDKCPADKLKLEGK